jgi:RNA polymerase sigma factor (sigma-70 family)
MKKDYALYTLEELLQDIKKDDRKAFDELYSQIWKQLYVKAYSKLKNEDLAKDIIQEIFIDFWNKRHHRVIKNVLAYLSQAVKYKVLDEFRKERYDFVEIDSFVEKIEEKDYADSQLIGKEFFDTVKHWIDTLPTKRKEIFRLKYLEGLSNKEIAAKLDISPKTVQNQDLNSSPELKKLLRQALFTFSLIFFGI